MTTNGTAIAPEPPLRDRSEQELMFKMAREESAWYAAFEQRVREDLRQLMTAVPGGGWE